MTSSKGTRLHAAAFTLMMLLLVMNNNFLSLKQYISGNTITLILCSMFKSLYEDSCVTFGAQITSKSVQLLRRTLDRG